MAKIKTRVKVDFTDLKQLKKFVTENDYRRLAVLVADEAKRQIARGVSPVKGKRRFTAYAAQREEAVSNYPKTKSVKNKFPGKKTRPVNLNLSGGYMSLYRGWATKQGANVGFRNPRKKTKQLFEAHNEGLNRKKKVPKRPHLPDTRFGENFTVSIQRKIKDEFARIVERAIKKHNAK